MHTTRPVLETEQREAKGICAKHDPVGIHDLLSNLKPYAPSRRDIQPPHGCVLKNVSSGLFDDPCQSRQKFAWIKRAAGYEVDYL
jgi:hypothetical protein